MVNVPRRPPKTKPGRPASTAARQPAAARPSRVAPLVSAALSAALDAERSPADELEARLREPEEGVFLRGVERRICYQALLEKIAATGGRLVEILDKQNASELFRGYEALEFEVAEVRERAAFGLGYEHGAVDGRAEAFRRHAPGLSEAARRLADHARALVVNEGLSPIEATALLLETAWSVLIAKPAPSPSRRGRNP